MIVQRRNHNQAELEVLSLWNYQQQPGTQTVLDSPARSGRLPNLGLLAVQATPSLTYAAGIWLETYHPLAAFAFLYTASCLNTSCVGTTASAQYISNTDGTQSYLALFSIRNEYMHIVAYYFTHTTSLVELQEGL